MSRKKKVPRYRRHRTWYALAFELLLVLPLDKLVFQAFVAEFSVADQWLAAGETTMARAQMSPT